MRQRAIGVNYIDIYFRTGLYPAPSLPFVLGNEGAGEVVEVGEGVIGFKPGDRVAYVIDARRLCRGAAHRREVAGQAAGRRSTTTPRPP